MVIVEVPRSPHLASLVPVIVNAILNEHQIVVDIVAFVSKGSFPRSRLGEKQRGSILAKWVKRSLPTEAQFAIRNLDYVPVEGDAGQPGMDPGRASMGSMKGMPTAGPSSLRNAEPAPQIPEHEEANYGHIDRPSIVEPSGNVSEMPGAAYYQQNYQPGLGINTPSPYSQQYPSQPTRSLSQQQPQRQQFRSSDYAAAYDDLPDFEQFGHDDAPPPAVPPKPMTTAQLPSQQQHQQHQQQMHLRMQASANPNRNSTPQIRLPGVDGREGFDLDPTEEDWTADAIMHMNLAGDMSRGA